MAKILIIDDNLLNLKLVRLLLSSAGYQVVQAIDAENGLMLIRTESPDLVLMDVQLPGMDGLTAARIIKEDPSFSFIPIVALTANAMSGDREALLAAGFDGYLSKPFHQQQLLDLVEKNLYSKALKKESP